jgi:hypothetical protein
MEFGWDPVKAAGNLHKHRISFREAASVFGDSLDATFPDPDHSAGEDRFITVGLSNRETLLWSHTHNGSNGSESLVHEC